MVTRTMKTTVAEVMFVNIENGATHTESITLPTTFKDEAKMLKAVTQGITNPSIKAVTIVSSKVAEALYGMNENDFLKFAHRLDPETRKSIETAEA